MSYLSRKRNVQKPSGETYASAFTQTELQERGWTVSMIRRHLGQPNSVVCCPTTYQFDTRRVYAAEASPEVQLDLLATENVRLMGPNWLRHCAAYIPAIMHATLTTMAERELAVGNFVAASRYSNLVGELPAAKPRRLVAGASHA